MYHPAPTASVALLVVNEREIGSDGSLSTGDRVCVSIRVHGPVSDVLSSIITVVHGIPSNLGTGV